MNKSDRIETGRLDSEPAELVLLTTLAYGENCAQRRPAARLFEVPKKNLKKYWVGGLTVFGGMPKMRATCSEQDSETGGRKRSK